MSHYSLLHPCSLLHFKTLQLTVGRGSGGMGFTGSAEHSFVIVQEVLRNECTRWHRM